MKDNPNRNEIVFVGCSGYGNIGDDTYPLVLKKYFKEYQLIFKNSNPPRLLPKNCAFLVIGPGGVIYQNNGTSHFEYMKEYMEQAITQNIPLVFLSCGVQKEDIEPWKKYLDYAQLITVRSQKDFDYLKAHTNNPNLYYYPDLCYLFDEYEKVEGLPKKYTVFSLISGTPSPFIKDIIMKTPASERLFVRMGAFEETRGIFEKYKNKFSIKTLMDVTPQKVNYIIKHAEKVITGRYHGLIFSRINNVNYTTGGTTSLKILNEDRKSKMSDAICHIKKFKEILFRYKVMQNKRVAIIHDDFSISGGGEKLVSILSEQLSRRGIYNEIYTFNISKETRKMIPKSIKINLLKTKEINLNDDTIKRYLFSKLALKGKYDFFIFSGHSSLCAAHKNKPNMLYCHNIPKSEPSFNDSGFIGEIDPNKLIVKNKDDIQIYFDKIKDNHPIEKFWRKIFNLKMKYIEKPILSESIANKIDAIRFLITRKVSIKDYKLLVYQATHKENLKQIDKICVNSRNIQDKVLTKYHRKSEIIYPPIEVNKYFFAESKNYWLSINRIVPLKRIEIQLKALANLPSERLFIIGDIENEDYYNYLKSIKPSNVTFLGVVNEAKKIKLLSECKGLIFTAKDEDFGMSVVEAMASGKPVIAPNEGGCRETILDGETGILIDKINDHGLYCAIASINRNFDKNINFYKNKCMSRAMKFNVSIFVDKILANICN